MNKPIPVFLPALLLTLLIVLSGCGTNAGSQTAGPGGNPDSVRIDFDIPTLDTVQSKHVVTLKDAAQVQHLYTTIFALPAMPQHIACTSDGGVSYTLTFQQGTKTLATALAARFGCQPVSITGETTDRQSNTDFWSQVDQAIYRAEPVATPEQLAILHTLQLDQAPLVAQITSVETVQRLYNAVLALPLAPQNDSCSTESLHEYQLVFHTAEQAISSALDKTCNTITLVGNYQSRSGTFVMSDQFKQLFTQTLAATSFVPAHPDRLTLEIQPANGTSQQSTVADTGLRQQLYTKIFALPAGQAQPNCPSSEDKTAGKGTWYKLNFMQWDLPVLGPVDAYEGTCTLISLDAGGQGTGMGLVLQGDQAFWDLVHRLGNSSTR